MAFFNHYVADYPQKMRNGMRTAVLLSVALIFVEVSSLAAQFEQGQWVMFAVISSQGESFDGTLAQMRLRFLGTLFGAVYSYFIYVAVGVDIVNEVAMFVPFLLLCGIIKQNRAWGYLDLLLPLQLR